MQELQLSKIKSEDRDTKLIQELINVWEKSVLSTHFFLSRKEVEEIKLYVPEAIKNVQYLVTLSDKDNKIIAFMGIEEIKLEMLFITPEKFRNGLGTMLLKEAILNFNVDTLTVNKQNPSAILFYEKMGFETYKISKVDEQNKPYPIQYMKIKT